MSDPQPEALCQEVIRQLINLLGRTKLDDRHRSLACDSLRRKPRARADHTSGVVEAMISGLPTRV